MQLPSLIGLGDLRLTAALAGAIAVWLMAAQSRRAACLWCLTYCSALGAVAASKIIYLGWGLQISALHFKAASGHAAGAAAVMPVLLYLLALPLNRGTANVALGAGWCISAAVACSLVVHGEHTSSEAFAGWGIGLAASTKTWWCLRLTPIQASPRLAGAALVMMAVIATGMDAMPASRWLATVALALSGAQQARTWTDY